MDTKQLSELIDLCRKKGVKCLRDGDVLIELHADALFPKTDYQKKKDADATQKSIDEMANNAITESEKALYWSAIQSGLEP